MHRAEADAEQGQEMKALWLLVFLVACAAPSSTEYRRGVLAPPPAPARPGVGAPVVGQPGRAPAAPQSPYTRVLPETPETMRRPGIWATSSPPDDGEFVLILGVPFPPATVNSEARTAARYCSETINRSALAVGRASFPPSLTTAMRRCAAARMAWQCADQHAENWTAMRKRAAKVNLAMESAWAATRDVALEMLKRECKGVPVKPVDEWVMPIAKEWVKTNG